MLCLLITYAALIDPRWDVREAASDTLLRLVDRHPAVYGPRLESLAREATEPEIRARVRPAIAAWNRWRVYSYVPKTVPVYPCIDCLPVPMTWGDARYRGLALEWMGGCTYPKSDLDTGPYWHRYRRATERMVRSMLLSGAEPGEVDRLLSRMWDMECAAKSDCGEKWAEAANWRKWTGGYPKPKDAP